MPHVFYFPLSILKSFVNRLECLEHPADQFITNSKSKLFETDYGVRGSNRFTWLVGAQLRAI